MSFTKKAVAIALVCFTFFPSLRITAASPAPKNCLKDAITQSVCIYQALLADVDKNYPMRGGGGIGRIVQNSTSSYSVYLLQEGREDQRIYEVKLSKGKVAITNITEKTIPTSTK